MTGRPGAVRPRYGRLAAAGSSLLVTLVALLGGTGVVPSGAPAAAHGSADSRTQARLASEVLPALVGAPAPTVVPTPAPPPSAATTPTPSTSAVAVPPRSGEGRRVVFDIGDQRVWLVDAQEEVRRTYLVSGSLTDNLSAGTFEVYSRSRWAVGIDDSGAMQYFVRFTRGANAAIGFHSIPTKDGRPLQTTAQLGTPQSHGCIRQELADARRLWTFAPLGTKVVVTA